MAIREKKQDNSAMDGLLQAPTEAANNPMEDINRIWTEFRASGSKELKDKLLVQYAGVVKHVAHRIAVSLPASVEYDDLVGSGIMGLIKAVESFEPERGLKFETFATHKIRGAILDELRTLDWVPRSVRQKARTLHKAYAQLENEYGRMPYDDEVAAHLNITLDEFETMVTESAPTTILSLEEALPSRGEENKSLSLIDTIEDTQGSNPLQELGFKEVKRILKETISALPEKEKLVVALYHYEELTLKEIGQVLNLTESRVSQIHSKAMLKLKGKLLQKIGA